MNTEVPLVFPAGDLGALSDGQLRALRAQIDALLAQRARTRQAQALLEIKRLAREHGLDVAVSAPARKRGRPPLADGRAAPGL